MSEEVSKHQILQAITRLSNEIQEALDQPNQTKEELNKKLKSLMLRYLSYHKNCWIPKRKLRY